MLGQLLRLLQVSIGRYSSWPYLFNHLCPLRWNITLVNKETLDTHLGNYILQIPYGIAAGSVNAYTVTLNPAMTSYADRVAVAVKINVSNTAGATININGLGVKTILNSKGAALTAGKLLVNSVYTLRYNDTNFILP